MNIYTYYNNYTITPINSSEKTPKYNRIYNIYVHIYTYKNIETIYSI